MISLVVDGSPSGCRDAARDLRTLRTSLATLADQLAAVRAGSSPAWTGLAGERFRTRTGSVIAAADEQAEVVGTVAAALDALADRLDGVRAAMTAARMTAIGAGIPVGSDGLPGAAGLPPDQLEAHARALAAVGHARDREAEAQRQWTAVLARVTWQPTDDPRVLGATATVRGLGVAEGVRPFVDRLEGLLPGSGSPGLPSVPLPPLLPPPGRGGVGPGVVFRQLRRMQEEEWRQMDDDTDLDGLTLTERLARGMVMGTATGVGAFGAIALCMRVGATRKAVPVCGDVGAAAGAKAGDLILRAVDDR
ncbi:MAG: hypothetical protein ABWX84_13095 [Nocardioides sp.]